MRILYFWIFSLFGILGCTGPASIPQDYLELNDKITESKELLSSSDYKVAEDRFTDLLQQSKKQGYHYLSARIYTYLGFVFDDNNLLKKSYVSYNEALKYWEKSDSINVRNVFVCYNNLALICKKHGDVEQSLLYFTQALKYESDLTNQELADLYYNMGNSYRALKTDEGVVQAESVFSKALAIAKESDYKEMIASVYYVIGVMYTEQDDFEIAEMSFNKCLAFAKQEDLKEYQECAYSGLGILYKEDQKFRKAIDYLERAVSYGIDQNIIFESRKEMGQSYYELGQYDNAISEWQEGLSSYTNIAEVSEAELYKKISEAYKRTGETSEALAYAESYNTHIQGIIESREYIKGDYNKILFKDIVSSYEEFQNQETFQHQLKYTYLPAASAFLLLMIGLLVSYRYYVRQKRETLAEEIKSFQVD